MKLEIWNESNKKKVLRYLKKGQINFVIRSMIIGTCRILALELLTRNMFSHRMV